MPFSLDYSLSAVPPSGKCPSRKALDAHFQSSSVALPLLLSPGNTTVAVRRASVPPLPELRAPPPLTPQGAPVKPEPEKNFLQKYWLYIAMGFIALRASPRSHLSSSCLLTVSSLQFSHLAAQIQRASLQALKEVAHKVVDNMFLVYDNVSKQQNYHMNKCLCSVLYIVEPNLRFLPGQTPPFSRRVTYRTPIEKRSLRDRFASEILFSGERVNDDWHICFA